ncbi:hypothetical protein ACVFI8_05285 [Agarivorans sp. MS3-6]
MTKQTAKKSLLGFLFFSCIFAIACSILFLTDMLTSLQTQLTGGFPVIYLDAKYSGYIGGAISTLAGALFMLWQFRNTTKGGPPLSLKNNSTKAFALAIIIGFLFIFPGQSIEKKRIEKIAEQHGYQACPPFTLLMSSATIDAWVNDFSLCSDPEVDKLARYGYRSEPAKIAKLLADRDSE